jgi:hypothetical protein
MVATPLPFFGGVRPNFKAPGIPEAGPGRWILLQEVRQKLEPTRRGNNHWSHAK